MNVPHSVVRIFGHYSLEISDCAQNQFFGHDVRHVDIDELDHSRAWHFVQSRGDGGPVARGVAEGFAALCNTVE